MLHYVRQGSGKTLVLIHGFLGGSDVFKAMIDDLSLHFDVLAVDLPGHGQSDVAVSAYTIEAYADAIVDVLKAEDIEKAIWLGHSMGGYIVLSALANEIFEIPKAILLHSAVNADGEEAIEKRTKQQQDIKRDGVESFVEHVIPNFLSPKSSPNLTKKAKDVANQASIEGLVAALEAMKGRTARQSFIDETSTPILVIEGTEDKVVPSIETNNSAITKVKVDSGHLGMIEDLDGVLQAIYGFLK
jgi:pimeloyl-ACP methyl ester carboxylesterase